MLEKYLDQACHNLICYSKNLSMMEPKEGYETEWENAKNECELLKVMIKNESKPDIKFFLGWDIEEG